MEQQGLWDQIKDADRRPPATNPPGGYWEMQVPLRGQMVVARTISPPYSRCPSDPSPSPDPNWAPTNYCGSLGSQRTPSSDANCQPYLVPNVNYDASGGDADHGSCSDLTDAYAGWGYDKRHLSGMFGRLGVNIAVTDVSDGTSNVIFVGEVLPNCHDHNAGFWHYNGHGNAHASTSVPINDFRTCAGSTDPCGAQSNWNLSWGFRSKHPGGAHFLLVDGSTRFLTQTIDYQLYQRLGGRADNLPTGTF